MAKVRKPQGADRLIVDAGGEVIVEAGGQILVKSGGIISAEPGGSIADNLAEQVTAIEQLRVAVLELRTEIAELRAAELTPKKGLAASLTTALGVADAELVYTAKTLGAAGDEITIEYEDPEEANAEIAVGVNGTAIKVVLVPGDGGAITTTASDISAAIVGSPAASALVGVANKAANDGSGVVTAMAATALAGGQDATPAKKGDVYFDATNIYIAIDDVAITDDGSKWRKIAHSAL